MKVILLLTVSAVLIYFAGKKAHEMAQKADRKKQIENGVPEDQIVELSWDHFFNGKNVPTRTILIGMSAGVVFGFIDNAGLFFGMDSLDPYLPGGQNTKAGWGNTFSDMLGCFLGTFVGDIIANYTETDLNDAPIWANAAGTVVGCILGIYIPKAITGKD